MVREPHAKHGVLTMGNEITEQEAREALNRIVYYCGHIGGRSKARGYDPGCDMVSMAEFAVQELSRRAAERAERKARLGDGGSRLGTSLDVRRNLVAEDGYWRRGF